MANEPTVSPKTAAATQDKAGGAPEIFAPSATIAKAPKIDEIRPTTAPSTVLFGLSQGHSL